MKKIIAWLKEFYIDHRIISTLICAVLAVTIIGGGGYLILRPDDSYVTHVKNGNKTVVKIDNVSITNDDIYYYILANSGSSSSSSTYASSQVVSAALSYIADKEITDKKAIQAQVETLKTQYSQYIGTTLDEYAKKLGYSDEAEYIKKAITPDAKQILLKEKYIKTNLKKLIKKYKIHYLKIITVETESAAQTIIDSVTDETSFNTAYSANSGTDAGLVSTQTSTSVVDKKIIKNLDNFTKDGIYKKVIKTSDSKYAVVWVYNTDYTKVKSSIVSSLNQISAITEQSEAYYLKKYNFDVYETKIKNLIKKTNKSFFKD